MRPMTAKQKRFCDEYVIDCNATQAAIRAGYSKRTAQVIGAENLTKPIIKEYLDKHAKKIENDAIMKAVEVLETLTSIAREKDAPYKDRIKCTELMGKRYNLFVDRVETELNLKGAPFTVRFEGSLDEWSK